jgi:hypothetical protein
MTLESVVRIEPARIEEPTAAIADVIAELSAAAAKRAGRASTGSTRPETTPHPCLSAIQAHRRSAGMLEKS